VLTFGKNERDFLQIQALLRRDDANLAKKAKQNGANWAKTRRSR
jgi:hypothetical protein